MAVLVHRLAASELMAARRWYRRKDPALEVRFVASVLTAIQLIETTPNLGAVFLKRYRWVRTRRFPYLLYYAPLNSSTVIVYAVAHTHRRLGYWLRRMDRP